MAHEIQLHMFDSEVDPIWSEFRKLESKQENLRRGIFQRYSALLDMVKSLQSELLELRTEIIKYDSPEVKTEKRH